MDAAALRHEAAAENLAHAHLPGFRRRIVHQQTFSSLMADRKDAGKFSSLLGTTARQEGNIETQMDFTNGSLKATGRSLDLALEGDGFFRVNGPEGPLFTRNGGFFASPEGKLVTVDGLAVTGRNGEINIPAGISSEAIEVTRDGQLLNNGVPFDQLEVFRFDDRSELIPVGASLFAAPPDAVPIRSDEIVRQGFLENSNVAYMDELVNIMVASRQYEAAQRAIRTVEQSLERRMQN